MKVKAGFFFLIYRAANLWIEYFKFRKCVQIIYASKMCHSWGIFDVGGSHAAPVIKLEVMSGRISIFSILIRMSPGKAITMTISGWIGEATRSSIPATAPKITPEVQGGKCGFNHGNRDKWEHVRFYFIFLLSQERHFFSTQSLQTERMWQVHKIRNEIRI